MSKDYPLSAVGDYIINISAAFSEYCLMLLQRIKPRYSGCSDHRLSPYRLSFSGSQCTDYAALSVVLLLGAGPSWDPMPSVYVLL
jgi:hypothetical protein